MMFYALEISSFIFSPLSVPLLSYIFLTLYTDMTVIIKSKGLWTVDFTGFAIHPS